MKPPFNPRNYTGLIPSGRLLAFQVASKAPATEPNGAMWSPFVNVVDDQGQTGTCEARAACGWLEVMIRASHSPNAFAGGKQLDAMTIHKIAWLKETGRPEMDYSPEYGLPMGASFRAMRALGLLPGDSIIYEIPISPGNLSDALHWGPFCMGTFVHDGWESGKMNRETGEIPWYSDLPNMGGHATLCTRMTMGLNNTPMLNVVNSWGEKDWGWHGIGQMSYSLFAATALCQPMQVRLPDKGVWKDWFGADETWKKYIG